MLLAALALVLIDASALRAQTPALGIHAGGPVRASLALGVMWLRETSGDRLQGPVVTAEPGLRGHRVSAGYLVMRGNLGQFASVHASGLTLRGDDGWRRYVGVDLQVQPAFVTGVRVGAFVPVGSAPTRRVMWMADVAFGL
jgi:hypothetical protein